MVKQYFFHETLSIPGKGRYCQNPFLVATTITGRCGAMVQESMVVDHSTIDPMIEGLNPVAAFHQGPAL
jgi:hypothetical protein